MIAWYHMSLRNKSQWDKKFSSRLFTSQKKLYLGVELGTLWFRADGITNCIKKRILKLNTKLQKSNLSIFWQQQRHSCHHYHHQTCWQEILLNGSSVTMPCCLHVREFCFCWAKNVSCLATACVWRWSCSADQMRRFQ